VGLGCLGFTENGSFVLFGISGGDALLNLGEMFYGVKLFLSHIIIEVVNLALKDFDLVHYDDLFDVRN
jgi:hypothetical protein